MQALDRKFVKTYESSATKHPFQYTTTVRHKGTVIAFAMDDQQRIYYTVLDLDRTTDPTRSQSGTTQLNTQLDVNCWSIEPQELQFPTEIEQVGYRIALQAIPRYRKSGLRVRPDENPDVAEIDGFLSTTARFTADAPIQVLSDDKYIYVFRQAIAANHELNLPSNSTKEIIKDNPKIVDNTLLLDRFIYNDGKLSQKLEVRYQRSRSKDLPASRKDALGYTDLEKKPFYEPTQELSLIRNLTCGQFSIVLVPTALPDVQRWQIFAYNSLSERMDCFSIERSSDGLFNTRGTRYYTSADPERRKEVFERQPTHPATGEALVPIVSQEGYAESALEFDGVATSVTIPAVNLDFAQQDFTIELWLQPATTSNAPECTLLEQRAGNGFSYSIRYFQSGAKAGKVWVGRSDGTKLIEITSTQTINDGQFHHIAASRTTVKNAEGLMEAQLRLVIDGQALVDDKGQAIGIAIDTTNVTKTEAPIYLGSRDGTTDFFTGTIDEVRMWQRGRMIEELSDDKHHRLIGNEPGLVGYWRFDEGIGSVVQDQTDFIQHGQIKTSIVRATDQTQFKLTDLERSALKFDGHTSFVRVVRPPISAHLLNFRVTSPFTIEAWVKIEPPQFNIEATETIIVESWDRSGRCPYALRYINAGENIGKVYAEQGTSTNATRIFSKQALNDGKFHHIAVVKLYQPSSGGAKLYLYIDGIEQQPAVFLQYNTDTDHTSPIYFGCRSGNSQFFTGKIDEVRVWMISRSHEQILGTMSQRLAGNEIGLMGYWRGDAESGEILPDHTEYSSHGQVHGMVRPLRNWVTSTAPVGDHPGVRRSSFTLNDRTFISGCSALLYYQQEQAESGYSTIETKPIKRSARVMLAMTTGDKKGVDARNYIAVMDFAVSREGTLAQVPDFVDLKPPEKPESTNSSLDEIAKLEEGIRVQKTEITEGKAELEKLWQTHNETLDLTQSQRGCHLFYQTAPGVHQPIFEEDMFSESVFRHPFVTAYKLIELPDWAAVKLEGKLTSNQSYDMTYSGPLNTTNWVNPQFPITNLRLTVGTNDRYTSMLDALRRQMKEKDREITRLEASLNAKQQQLDRAREAVTKTVSLPMAFLHTDAMGFTILGSLLTFAWTKDAPILVESVDGRVSLYFRGEADQFFAAYYDVVTGRASFRFPPVDSTLLFTARTSGSTIKETKITIAPSPANPETCQVTIANPILKVQEVWNQVPRKSQDFAGVLNGTAQPVYVGKLVRKYAGEVNQIDLDGRRSQLEPGATLLVGEAQTKVTIVKTEPIFEGTIGFKGQALEFDGEKDYVQIPDAQTLGLTNDSFTIEAWVSISDFQGKNDDRPILGTDDPTQRLRDKALQAIVRKGILRLGFFENDTPGKTPLKPNTWYHLTWRYDKAKQEQAIFINGECDGLLGERTPFVGTGRLAIGRCNGDRYFKGFIGEVRIWKEARSEADIRADMSRSYSERSPKLTACWRFVFAEDSRDPSRTQLIARDYATDNSTRNGVIMGNPQLIAIGDHSRVQIQAIDLTVDENESVYLLPYDYAVHARNKSAQISGSLNNGSRLVSVESQKPKESVVDGAAEANEIGPDCRWFADSQGNALNLDGGSTIAPATNAANFAAESDCSLETWINPTIMPKPVSVVRQNSILKTSETSQYHLKLIPETESPSAFEFDMREDWIETPRSLSDIGFSKSFKEGGTTIEAHIYIISPMVSQYIMSTKSREGISDSSMSMSILDNKLQFRIGGQLVKEDYRTLNLNTWYSVACTTLVEGLTLRVNTFVNGDRDPQEQTVRRIDFPAIPDSSKVIIGAAKDFNRTYATVTSNGAATPRCAQNN